MLSLSMTRDSLNNVSDWSDRNVRLPQFDISEVRKKSAESPTWLHFGAGNIFRGFIARLSQDLLNQGLISTGIIAADTFDYEIIDRIYRPYDDLTLMVDLKPDGSTGYEIIGSVTESRKADPNDQGEMQRLREIVSNPSLQVISFTITEKGYALRDMHGNLLPIVKSDMEQDPCLAHHAMSILCALVWARFQNGAAPLALASMDNCSQNGKKLRSSVLEIAQAWLDNGFVTSDFLDYLNDSSRISFPWSMIDKITPRPDPSVEKKISEMGISGMSPFTTARGTFIAPFVNAEVPQYLVIEDS
ncbi:MAG: mannitol dehydrogenase family protein, partial [Saccharofermentanaceae bacterium]|nr:mannitol dehydrogenase family protein [Saccharofermentanaceae bacterium]